MPGTPYLPPETLPGEDWAADDPALRRFLAARLPTDVWKELEPRLAKLGRVAPRDVDPLARQADTRSPVLRADGSLEFDPSYRGLQQFAREHMVFTYHAHTGAPRLATFALGYLYAQAESGYFCPACMTDGAAFALQRHNKKLAARYNERLLRRGLEGAYEGAMYLTERTGGSDVGSTTTVAEPASDGSWRLTGDKWFCSNAGADVTLTLARMPGGKDGTRGLGLFLLPGHLPDGRVNSGIWRARLKEKLGVRSMPTAEVELRTAYAELIVPAPDGFKAMADMVNLSRLYNAVASVAVARRALREGIKNGDWRSAFGKPLREHPLYARSLAALACDVRGALALTLDTAHIFDRAETEASARRGRAEAPSSTEAGDERAYKLLRALTPLAKTETARLAVRAASEACEMLGGNGYVQPWVTERLLRDAQVLPIWEGTSNIQALDFLRACAKDGAADALVEDSLALLKDAPGTFSKTLAQAWESWAVDMMAPNGDFEREASALRMLTRAYHLRAATLLAHDARDGDHGAMVHALGYVERHILGDEAAFDTLVRKEAGALATL